MWKDVKGFEGVYLINELGEVKRIETGKILTACVGSHGYYLVSLWKDGKGNSKNIHRLLAETFIENNDPSSKRTVNHIDGNKLNNNLNNLEWASYSRNNQHAYDSGLKKISDKFRARSAELARERSKGNSYRSIPVIMIDEHGNDLQEFDSIKHAADEVGCHRAGIYRVLKGKVQTIKNMRFKYKEEN